MTGELRESTSIDAFQNCRRGILKTQRNSQAPGSQVRQEWRNQLNLTEIGPVNGKEKKVQHPGKKTDLGQEHRHRLPEEKAVINK